MRATSGFGPVLWADTSKSRASRAHKTWKLSAGTAGRLLAMLSDASSNVVQGMCECRESCIGLLLAASVTLVPALCIRKERREERPQLQGDEAALTLRCRGSLAVLAFFWRPALRVSQESM